MHSIIKIDIQEISLDSLYSLSFYNTMVRKPWVELNVYQIIPFLYKIMVFDLPQSPLTLKNLHAVRSTPQNKDSLLRF